MESEGGKMRVLYLCCRGLPENSDYLNALDFFKSFPPELRPVGMEGSTSTDMMFFADVGNKTFPIEFFGFAVVFLSESYFRDECAMFNLGRVQSAFISNLVCIDLYDELSEEHKEYAREHSKRFFSREEGEKFLTEELPEIARIYDLDAKRINEVIENEGIAYLDARIEEHNKRERCNKYIAYGCYGFSFLFLIVMLIFTFVHVNSLFYSDLYLERAIAVGVGIAIMSAVIIALSRFFFLLGKSFMVESVRAYNRAHAMHFGKLYLQIYKENFDWTELKDVLKTWNIDSGSAFINLDAKDLEVLKLGDLLWKGKEQ